jgi:BirA family transcriptional regulator, biotin operon repressor / biotin---[acetyl-CoA-carboxylase] ligase
LPEGIVIIADSQTHGKGRQGRSWHSEPGVGLYLSTLLKPDLPPEKLSCITLMAGVATASAIQQQTSAPVRLKWPNDILINGKKLAGILCECIPQSGNRPAIIIGIGINLNHSHFPENIQNTATSLKLESGKTVSRTDLALSLIQNLDAEYEEFLQGKTASLIHKWTESSDMLGKTVTVYQKGKSLTGTAIGLNLHGRLILQTPDGGQHLLDSGEVSFNPREHDPQTDLPSIA